MLDLLSWRRAVADLYATVRSLEPAEGHALWAAGRSALLRESSQSPLLPGDPRHDGIPVAPYDPSFRVTAELRAAPPASRVGEGGVPMDRIGVFDTPWGPLDAWWLTEYSGGLFVPVRDGSSGSTSYGGGRSLLDTAKGADLGSSGGSVVLDLNFLYHPSCAYNAAWACPLAPPGNALAVGIPVGELLLVPDS